MNQESKNCKSCGRIIERRKKWERCWNEVTYCYDGCKSKKTNDSDSILEEQILSLLESRGPNKTACPSEIAKNYFGDNWRNHMEQVRCAARRFVVTEKILITQQGIVVNPSTVKGAIRLRLN
jgi:hypothetical protein